jgi:cytochrome oxidase Cu insertion factor (SCO1/SenC/PrrC family)
MGISLIEFIVSLNFAIVTFQMYMFQCKETHQTSVPKRFTTSRPAIRGPFKLYDTESNVVNDTTLQGSWMLMYFGYKSSLYVGASRRSEDC